MGDATSDDAYEPPRLIPGFGFLDPDALERIRDGLVMQPESEPAPTTPEKLDVPVPDTPEKPDKAELPKRKPKANLDEHGLPLRPPL